MYTLQLIMLLNKRRKQKVEFETTQERSFSRTGTRPQNRL